MLLKFLLQIWSMGLLGSHAAMANPLNNSATFQHHFNQEQAAFNNLTSHKYYVIIIQLQNTHTHTHTFVSLLYYLRNHK